MNLMSKANFLKTHLLNALSLRNFIRLQNLRYLTSQVNVCSELSCKRTNRIVRDFIGATGKGSLCGAEKQSLRKNVVGNS